MDLTSSLNTPQVILATQSAPNVKRVASGAFDQLLVLNSDMGPAQDTTPNAFLPVKPG
jgi:hypothetical protein